MTYHRKDGTSFTLASHTAEEWAEVRRAQLIRLGCSEQYAEAIAAIYAV